MTKTLSKPRSKPPAKPRAAVETDIDPVDRILKAYAEKGVFKGYARLEHSSRVAHYRIRWFYARAMDISLDRARKTISLPDFLPSIDLDPAIAPNLRAFMRRFEDMPEHRRVDETRAQLTLRRKGNALTLAIKSLDGDLEYATRKLIHIANEVFHDFLGAHTYDQYKIEALNVDPEMIWG